LHPSDISCWCTGLIAFRNWWIMPSPWRMLARRWASRSGSSSHKASLAIRAHALDPRKVTSTAQEDKMSTLGRISISTSAHLSSTSRISSQLNAPLPSRIDRTLRSVPLRETTTPHLSEAMLASSVGNKGILRTLVPRGMSRALRVRTIIVGRDRPLNSRSSSSSRGTTTRLPRATEDSRIMFKGG